LSNLIPTLTEIPEQQALTNLKTERSFELLQQFSSIVVLRRVVAWCIRFVNNCRTKDRTRGNLNTCELKRAMSIIVKMVQAEAFASEIRQLETGSTLKASSKLVSLHPFLDSFGMLRVGGRLKHSSLNYEQKHQIILPERHHITDLIIRHAHTSQLHTGPQATLYHIRQKFWPINGKTRVKKIVRECITCFKSKS